MYKKTTLYLLCLSFVLLLALTVSGANFTIIKNQPYPIDKFHQSSEAAIDNSMTEAYSGTLRVYLVEPDSRWNDSNGDPYEFGFLDFAFSSNIAIDADVIWEDSMDWNSTTAGLGNISSDNIMAIGAMFDLTLRQADAYPGNGYYYYSFEGQAAAGATPGTPGKNETAPGFTHTVFAEEGTATW